MRFLVAAHEQIMHLERSWFLAGQYSLPKKIILYILLFPFSQFLLAQDDDDSEKALSLKATRSLEIKTDEGTVFLVYIALDTDPNQYDTYLLEALSAALAADLAYAITNNATLAKNYEATAEERLREARFIDATENSLGTIESNEFTDARL